MVFDINVPEVWLPMIQIWDRKDISASVCSWPWVFGTNIDVCPGHVTINVSLRLWSWWQTCIFVF